jgi:hypothetical protein
MARQDIRAKTPVHSPLKTGVKRSYGGLMLSTPWCSWSKDMVDFPDPSIKCPYTGFAKPCRELALSCPKFVHIAGHNPNTGEPVNRYGCSDGFLPMLLIENAQQARQTGAAVESFRNEMVRLNIRASTPVLARSELGLRTISDGSNHLKGIANARDDRAG